MIVYVASPYETAPEVRELHKRLTGLGIAFTSMWAEQATGAEDFSKFSPEKLRLIAEENDDFLLGANAVLVLSRETGGRETYAECRFALCEKIPVFWVGKLTLSAWLKGVIRCESLEDTLAKIVKYGVDGMQESLLP